MRLNRKSIFGRIDQRGKLDIYKGELEAFCKLHPGRSVVLRLEVMPNTTSGKTRGYYFSYILPTITRAFYELGTRFTEDQCDMFLRNMCPSIGRYDEEDGKRVRRVVPIEDMDSAEANEFLDWVKEYAAENLCCILDDPC